MEPVFYVLAILGCGDDQAACQPVRIEPVHYQSVAACEVASGAMLRASTDLPFPVVIGECRSSLAKTGYAGAQH